MGKPVMLIVILVCLIGNQALAQSKPSLKGSKSSVNRMFNEAKAEDLTRLPNADKVDGFVDAGLLVRIADNGNYHLGGVSNPFVRPEVRTFVERLSKQSRSSCEDGLTVTSATRPLDRQPRNASKKSVHPTGMAVDFRVPSTSRCEAWLKKTLLDLEGKRVLEATRERHPPHFHVAVFPEKYNAYLAGKARPKPAAKTSAKKSSPAKTTKKSVGRK